MSEDLLAEIAASGAASARAERKPHPEGWEPGVAWNGNSGTITSRPLAEPTPDWTALLTAWGFDPALFEIVEPVQVRTWDAAVGNGEVRTMWYYRAGLRGRSAAPRVDVDELVKQIGRHKPARAPRTPATGAALVVCLSDWQIGKEGTTAAVDRLQLMIDGVAARIRALRPSAVYVLGLGDVVEGCDGHYDMQTFQAELNVRDQMTVARRLIVKALTTWAPLAPRVVVACVGGNHGEERRKGRSYTDLADNKDVAVFEQAAEILAANPAAYGHVSFVIPREQLTLTLDVAGTIVGLAHGHQARRGGGTAQSKVQEWWRGQAFGMRPIGDATVLFSGHFHHFAVLEDGPRTHFQAPTMDSGSQWFEESAGKPSAAGTLTVLVGPHGWSDLQLIR